MVGIIAMGCGRFGFDTTSPGLGDGSDAGAGAIDAALPGLDGGTDLDDGGTGFDTGMGPDGGVDGGPMDAGAADAGIDAGAVDGGAPDVGIPVDWWDASWQRRIQVDLSNPGISETVRDFPLLVSLTGSAFAAVRASTGGQDLRFIDADATTLLPHEVERWDDDAQEALIWVRVPAITPGGAADRIWMYFANPAPGVPPLDPRSVWSNGYLAVWHLAEVPTNGATMRDASPNAKNGTANGTVAADGIAAPVGRGVFFDGSSHVRIASSATDVLAVGGAQLTLEAWVRRESPDESPAPATIVGRQFGTSFGDSYTMLGTAGANQTLRFCSLPCSETGSADMPRGVWTHVASVLEDNMARFYVNGSAAGIVSASHSLRVDDNDVTIGAEENGAGSVVTEFWTGGIDEVRISGVARSTAWIETHYRSMNGTLSSLQSIESL